MGRNVPIQELTNELTMGRIVLVSSHFPFVQTCCPLSTCSVFGSRTVVPVRHVARRTSGTAEVEKHVERTSVRRADPVTPVLCFSMVFSAVHVSFNCPKLLGCPPLFGMIRLGYLALQLRTVFVEVLEAPGCLERMRPSS